MSLVYNRHVQQDSRELVKSSITGIERAIAQHAADQPHQIVAENLTCLADGDNSRIMGAKEKPAEGAVVVSGRYFGKEKRYEVSSVAKIAASKESIEAASAAAAEAEQKKAEAEAKSAEKKAAAEAKAAEKKAAAEAKAAEKKAATEAKEAEKKAAAEAKNNAKK